MKMDDTGVVPAEVAAVDRVKPDGPWRFDAEVTDVFDNMLERSIPHYRSMRDAVLRVGRSFVPDEPHVLDIGASRGEAIAPFVEESGQRGTFVAVEPAAPMADALRRRFARGSVEVLEMDARQYEPGHDIDLVLSVLTLQFIPIEHRQRLVKRLYDGLRPGGALILVEKVLGSDTVVNELMVDVYHQVKIANGYTREDVDRKALALEGVLVPVTAAWNEELLVRSGFGSVECFWRWMNFVGWVAVK